MKKKFLSITILLVLILVALLQANVFAATHTLEEIAEKFNNNSIVKLYEENGYALTATVNEEEPNILAVSFTNEEHQTTIISYKLEGSILSYEHLTEENVVTAVLLADAIGQVNGYEEGELYETLNSEEIKNYTVQKEGFEIKENGSYYSVKMDINKKVPLIDLSEFYLKPDDFDMIKKIINDGETGNQTGKNLKMSYDLIIRDDENDIYIGERDKTTQSTYKSILSALEVMYGEKAVEYFKSIYPDFSKGNVQLDGISIETDVDIDLEENPIFEGSKVVLVTINNEYMKDEILRTEYIGETIKRGDKTITLDFTANKSYKLGFFDSATSIDAALLYKYILEPLYEKEGFELEDNTAYFNIENGKIVVGDKNNSIFKIVIADEYLEILPTKTDVDKTTAEAKHSSVLVKEYEEGKGADHFRFGEYNVTVNVIYGNEAKEETKPASEANPTHHNPQTGDNVAIYMVVFAISFVIIAIVGNKVRKSLK